MGKKVSTFKDLTVWQRGMDLSVSVYEATAAMPREEIFGLTNQMRRAATSIPLNIAEGFGKHTRPELTRGLRLATGSLFELMTAYELSVRLEFMTHDQALIDLMNEQDRLISAFIRGLERKTTS
jgi:four helix bundle protein